MTTREKERQAIYKKEAIGIYGLSNVSVIEVLEIDEVEERVYYCLRNGERGKLAFSKIYYNQKGDPYFMNRVFGGSGSRIYLNECLRTNI